jgi:oligoribonuclease
MNAVKGPFLVWFDTEYTSLEPEQARLVQVAMVVTDMQGRRVGTPEQDLVSPVRLEPGVPVSDFLSRECPDLVRQSRSDHAPSAEAVDRLLSERLEALTGPVAPKIGHRPILAGNTIHADRFLAQRFLPRFLDHLHYRQLDVSSLKLLWLNAGLGPEFEKENTGLVGEYLPGWTVPTQPQRHDALYDVLCSIAELNYYRTHFLKSGPA